MKAGKSDLTELLQAYGDATMARALLESWRRPNGPVCPHCKNAGEKAISKLEAQKTSRRGVAQGSISVMPTTSNPRSPSGRFWNVPTCRFPNG